MTDITVEIAYKVGPVFEATVKDQDEAVVALPSTLSMSNTSARFGFIKTVIGYMEANKVTKVEFTVVP